MRWKLRQGEIEKHNEKHTGRILRAAEKEEECAGKRGGVGEERMPERSLGKNDEVICIRFSVAAAWIKAGCWPER